MKRFPVFYRCVPFSPVEKDTAFKEEILRLQGKLRETDDKNYIPLSLEAFKKSYIFHEPYAKKRKLILKWIGVPCHVLILCPLPNPLLRKKSYLK